MVLFLFSVCAAAFIGCTCALYVTKLKYRKLRAKRLLLTAWRKARHNRLSWRKTHSYIKNPFDSEEYESLWDREIGLEALIVLRSDPEWECISFNEYRGEKEKFELEQEEE